jgi:glycosyltransferase involved in cell wall biosynthesis
VIVFPASALARKGAYVLAAALRGIDCRLRVLGSRSDDLSLFAGIDVEYRGFAGDVLQDARLVVLPAYIEHGPRVPIAARAKRIPVIATPAVGLESGEDLTLVAPGDVDALRQAMLASLAAA